MTLGTLFALAGCGSSGNTCVPDAGTVCGNTTADGGRGDGGVAPSGNLDLTIQYVPNGASTPLDCTGTSVSMLKYDIYDDDNGGAVAASASRGCSSGTHFTVPLAAGHYTVRAYGLNAQATICYQGDTPTTVSAGQTSPLVAEAAQTPGGSGAGCTYP